MSVGRLPLDQPREGGERARSGPRSVGLSNTAPGLRGKRIERQRQGFDHIGAEIDAVGPPLRPADPLPRDR